MGLAVSIGTNAPKKLPKLLQPPVKPVRNEDLPMGPIRIPKKKKA